MTSIFYAYQAEVDNLAVTFVLERAMTACTIEEQNDLMGASVQVYTAWASGPISLVLIPSDSLTWGMWRTTISGLWPFRGYPVELSFNITNDTRGGMPVGWGLLKAGGPAEDA